MVLEDYTLKHVWGLRTSTVQRIYKDSDPDHGKASESDFQVQRLGRAGYIYAGGVGVTKWWFPVFCTGVGGVNFRCSTVERPGHTGRSAGEGQHGGWAGSSRGAAAVPRACIGAGSR